MKQRQESENDTGLRGRRIVAALRGAITAVAEGTGVVSVMRLRVLRAEQDDRPLTLIVVAEGDPVHTGIRTLLDACVPDETLVRGCIIRRPEPEHE